jgi:hypothetical protein
MARVRSTETVRRYTDLPALLHLLKHRRITLLDPATWDDTNDSYYLLKYKEKRKLKSVLALCLTQAAETYHHWRVFSHGPSGVCIDFHKAELIAALESETGVSVRPVDYRKMRIDQKQVAPPKVSELPFLKRHGFVAEDEVRAVYESSIKTIKFLDISIDLRSVRRITLSPWLNQRLKPPVMDAIRAIPGCSDLDVRRSTLVGNTEWKKLGDKAD